MGEGRGLAGDLGMSLIFFYSGEKLLQKIVAAQYDDSSPTY